MAAGAALPIDVSYGLQYGPAAQVALQRSRYLAQALESMRDSSNAIRTPTQLWTTLLANAITAWSKDKADRDALSAVKADREAYSNALMQSLDDMSKPSGGAPKPSQQGPDAPTATAPPPVPVQQTPLPPMTQPSQPIAFRMPVDGRVTSQFGVPRPGGRTHNGVDLAAPSGTPVLAPAEGEVIGLGSDPLSGNFVRLRHPDGSVSSFGHLTSSQVKVGDRVPAGAPIALSGATGDATGPHVHYVHRDAQGQAVDPMRLAQASAAPAALGMNGPAMPPAMPGPNAQNPRYPSAATATPAAGGSAPAGPSPQAAPAGASALGVTAEQRALAQRLLSDPRTYEQGVAYVAKLRQEAVDPVKWSEVSINGVPYQQNPYTGELRPTPLPPGVHTQVMPAQEAGVATAQPGVYVQRDPLGNIKDVPGAPPPGFRAVPGGALQYVPGGPADPYRPQTPASGYRYGAGGQEAIPGGPADVHNPQAILAGTEGVRKEIAPVIDQAIKLKRNIEGVRVGLAQQNGAGDIAAINGLQRLIDEGVVREGDVTLQLKGQGLAGGVAGLRGYLNSDGFFADPAIRSKIGAVANQLYANINDSYRSRVMGYRPITENAYGPGSFEKFVLTPDVVGSLGWGANAQPPAPAAAPSPGQGAATGSVDAAIAEALKRGLPLPPKWQQRARELGWIK